MPAPRYYLAEGDRRTGPHTLAALKQFAEIRTITPDTLHATEAEPNAWSPLRDAEVLHDELFPARPHYALAPNRPVEHLNNPSDAPVMSVDAMLRANLAHQQAAAGELLKPLPPRSNRRRNDYLFTVAAGAVVSLLPWLFVPLTAGLLLLSLAAALFIALCAAWVFFVVMDRY